MALIECPECHKQVSDKADACPNCGCPINKQNHVSDKEQEYLCCPKCHSRELHAEQQGFSGSKALAGAALFGNMGILAGTIGNKDVRITCLKCGHQFKAGEAFIEKGDASKNELEERIVSLLKNDKTIEAVSLYQKETNDKNLKQSMDYINEIARKYNITLKQNKGCSILLSLCIIIVPVVSYFILG